MSPRATKRKAAPKSAPAADRTTKPPTKKARTKAAGGASSEHVRKDSEPPAPKLSTVIELMPVRDLIPARVNDQIYKKVEPGDPAIRTDAAKLRETIDRFGVEGIEALTITLDNVIVSGHRRRAMLLHLGEPLAPVRRLDILSTDHDFPCVLVGFNGQRVKSVDEQVREAVVTTNKDAAYDRLIAHRQAQAAAVDERARDGGHAVVAVGKAAKRSKITAVKRPMLDAVIAVINANREYWPLTLRQVHYRLLNDPPLRNADDPDSTYANNQKCYADLSDLLARARLAGEVSWASIDDPTRPAERWAVHASPKPYLAEQMKDFLAGYRRDLLQSQAAYFEVVGEKMTVGTIIERAVSHYGMPYSIGRGYSSVDARHKLAQRFRRSGKDRMVLFFLSDFDPEGQNIPDTFAASMRHEFGVRQITPVKAALTAEQVRRLNLPPGMKAKKKSSRTKKFVAEFGNNVYELEAVDPAVLEGILRDTIEELLDMALFRHEQQAEAEDAATLDAYRQRAMVALGGMDRPADADGQE